MANTIFIRDVIEEDLKIFFEQQRDPAANLMAGFPARNAEDFASHWKNKVFANTTTITKTIVFNECVAGDLVSWEQNGKRLVGYWIGQEYWGKCIATTALREFLTHVTMRPLYAYVANHNKASIRVLEKCGFIVSSRGTFFSEAHGGEIEETIFILE